MAFLNRASIAQRPKDPSFLSTERANLTELDGHNLEEKPSRGPLWYAGGSVAQWIAHCTSRLPNEAIQRLWVRVPPES